MIKQSNTQSFHGTLYSDYYQTNIKSPSSKTTQQGEFSPAKKFTLAPNTTKHSNEYFSKGNEAFLPMWNKKKVVRNTSTNSHSERSQQHPNNSSIDEKNFKSSSIQEQKARPCITNKYFFIYNDRLKKTSCFRLKSNFRSQINRKSSQIRSSNFIFFT